MWCPYLGTTEQESRTFGSNSVILLGHKMMYITRAPDITVSRTLPAQEFTGSTPNHFHTFGLIPRKVLESKHFSLKKRLFPDFPDTAREY